MLRLPPVTVLRPRDLQQALQALGAEPRPRVLAGGTDLLVALKYGHVGGASLLSLSSLPLAGIRRSNSHWDIGAGTTLWDLARWAPPTALLAVSEAAAAVGAPPIRSRATVGGNVCLDTRCCFYNQSAFWRSGRPACFKAGGEVCHVVPGGRRCNACHQADLPPVLLVLDASARLESARGSRTSSVQDLYTGDGMGPLALEPGELLTRVVVAEPPPSAGAAYEKLRMRRGLDFPAASAAVYLERAEDGTCLDPRVALTALGSAPVRVPEAESALAGSKLEPEALDRAAEAARAAARPVKNADLTPAYRKKVAGVLVQRAAKRAWDRTRMGDSS